MQEPRWHHERWAILMLVMLLPPLGLAAAATSPGISRRRKWAWGLFLLGAAVLGAAVDREAGLTSQFFLDLKSSVHHRQGRERFTRSQSAQRIEAYHAAFRAEPPPGEENWFGSPAGNQSALSLGLELDREGRLTEARLALAAASVGAKRVGPPPEGDDSRASFVFGRAQLALALVELKMGKAERAADRLNRLLDRRAIEPEHPDLSLLRGRLLARETPQEARKVLMELIWKRYIPHFDEVYSELSKLDLAERKLDAALLHSLLALRAEPNRPELLQAALVCARAARDAARSAPGPAGESSRDLAREALRSELAVRAFARAVNLQVKLKAGDAARGIFEKLLSRRPSFPGAALCELHLAGHFEYDLEDFHRAADSYSRAAGLTTEPQLQVEAHYKLGRVLVNLGLPKGALNAYRRAAELAAPGSDYGRRSLRACAQIERGGATRQQVQKLERWVERLMTTDEEEE